MLPARLSCKCLRQPTPGTTFASLTPGAPARQAAGVGFSKCAYEYEKTDTIFARPDPVHRSNRPWRVYRMARIFRGRSVLDSIISTMRFVFFGKARAARRRLWRGLTEMAGSGPVVAGVQREIDSYLVRLGTCLCARPALCRHRSPPTGRRPALVRQRDNRSSDRRVTQSGIGICYPERMPVAGRRFVLTVIDGIAVALVDERPSPKRPLPAGNDWMIVGVNDQFEWRIPFKGPAWPGDSYLLELTSRRITRNVRKAAADAIAQMEISLPSLPRSHRNQILREAGSSFEQLLARA